MKQLIDVSNPFTAFMLVEKGSCYVYQLNENDEFCYTKETVTAGIDIYHGSKHGLLMAK